MIARPMYATFIPQTSVAFVSQSSIDSGLISTYGLQKRIVPVRGCRTVGKADLKFNGVMPKMRVDPETYVVEADGVVCEAEPIVELPMAQSCYIY